MRKYYNRGVFLMSTSKMINIAHSLGWSWKGSRSKENQDSFLNWPDRLLWVVADGVGSSYKAGDASKTIANMLMEIPEPNSFDEHIENVKRCLRSANTSFRSLKSDDGTTPSSTVVVLLIFEDMAACLWAGDSRCYMLRNTVLYQCTRDHSLRQEKIDSGELTIIEAHRMVRGNIITNAVGVQDELFLEEVHFPLLQGDKFLLCSDGFSNLIPPDIIHGHLSRSSVQNTIKDIKESFQYRIAPDNITCVSIFLLQAN